MPRAIPAGQRSVSDRYGLPKARRVTVYVDLAGDVALRVALDTDPLVVVGLQRDPAIHRPYAPRFARSHTTAVEDHLAAGIPSGCVELTAFDRDARDPLGARGRDLPLLPAGAVLVDVLLRPVGRRESGRPLTHCRALLTAPVFRGEVAHAIRAGRREDRLACANAVSRIDGHATTDVVLRCNRHERLAGDVLGAWTRVNRRDVLTEPGEHVEAVEASAFLAGDHILGQRPSTARILRAPLRTDRERTLRRELGHVLASLFVLGLGSRCRKERRRDDRSELRPKICREYWHVDS